MISIPMKINSATSIPVTVSASVVQPTGQMQAKTNINPTTSSQTITPDVGYDGLSSVQINAMPSGSAATPATNITANPTISVNSSTGVITASVSETQSVTPTVSAGYVASGTAGTVTVSGSNTSNLTTQGAQTITPTTSDQTIASGKYLTGAQTIKGDANLVASNIKKDVEIFGVTGSYEGGGGGAYASGTVTPTDRVQTYTFTAPNCNYFAIFPITAPDTTTGKAFCAGCVGVAGRLYVVRSTNNGSGWHGAPNDDVTLSKTGDVFSLKANTTADSNGRVLQVGTTYAWCAWS